MTDLLAWIRSVPYFKSGTLITILNVVLAVLAVINSLPVDASTAMMVSAVVSALIKALNPADSPTTLTGKE